MLEASIPTVEELRAALGNSVKDAFIAGWNDALEETQMPKSKFPGVWTALADSMEPLLQCPCCKLVRLAATKVKFCHEDGERLQPVRHRDLLTKEDMLACLQKWWVGKIRCAGHCIGKEEDSVKTARKQGYFWCGHLLHESRPHMSYDDDSMDMRL